MANKETITIEGYVLRSTGYKENDAMVNILTKDGVRSFSARGGKKAGGKNSMAIQPMAYSSFTLNVGEKGNLSLSESKCLLPPPMKDELDAMTCLSFVGELSSRLSSEEDGEDSFLWLKSALEALGGENDPWSVSLIYFAHAISSYGAALDVDECVVCHGKKGMVGVSYENGGFVCQGCAEGGEHRYDAYALKVIRYIFKCGLSDLTRVVFPKKLCCQLFLDLSEYLDEITGIHLKSISLIDSVSKV